MTADVQVIIHPLVQHKLTLLRRKTTSTLEFRRLLGELSALMAYEVTRDLPLHEISIQTPVGATTGRIIDGKKVVFVAILRAGIGILDGMLSVVPGARVGHVSLYRDPATLQAIEYYFRMPRDMHERGAIVVDPMLATGNSAVAALDRLKATRPRSIRFVCLVSCPEGIAHLQQRHPDVPIFTAAIDERLNEHGYIVPGLGDAGDRYFGTKQEPRIEPRRLVVRRGRPRFAHGGQGAGKELFVQRTSASSVFRKRRQPLLHVVLGDLETCLLVRLPALA